MSRPSTATLCALAISGLALAGCGGGSKTGAQAGSSKSSSNEGYPYGSSTTSSTTAGASSSGATVVTAVQSAGLGTILAAGPQRLTVYLFQADSGSKSACLQACAQVWPPVTTSGPPRASGGALASKLGMVRRADGSEQVTYAGHLLYYYASDTHEGTANGQGLSSFGAPWYVLSPSGFPRH